MLERVAETHMKARNSKPLSAAAVRYAQINLFGEQKQQAVFDYLVGHFALA